MGPVWPHGVDDVPLDAVEWWRVVALQGTCGTRLLFVDQVLADDFARLLVADCCETVLVEHWRDGERTAARLVGRLSPN